MEEVLLKLARALNKADVKWAVGASMLLKYYKIVETARDIDILVSTEDIEKCLTALSEFERAAKVHSKAGFSSVHFEKYCIDGVGIDVMFGLTISSDKGKYSYPFENETPLEIEVKGEKFYYASLQEWCTAYSYMIGREKKVELIEAYFQTVSRRGERITMQK